MHVGVCPLLLLLLHCQFQQRCQPDICSENTMSILCMLQVCGMLLFWQHLVRLWHADG